MSRLFGVGLVLALCEVCKWDLEMAGAPDISPLDREDEPKTVADLKRDFEGGVPENICQVFGRGVEHQLQGRDQEAQREYAKLRRIPRGSGDDLDLATVSGAFRHNLRLLEKRHHDIRSGEKRRKPR